MKIEIITPCSRPENLNYLYRSIFGDEPIVHDTRNWHVCFDLSKVQSFYESSLRFSGIAGGVAGKLQINHVLTHLDMNCLQQAFVYVIDDDNLLHPDFFKVLNAIKRTDFDIITFDQQLEDGTIRKGNDPRICHIDQAQFLIRKSIHEEYEQLYEADGILIEKLVKKYPNRWLYIPETLCYYNRLRWKQ